MSGLPLAVWANTHHSIREANSFVVGDSLVSIDGIKLAITDITHSNYHRKVYNYEPKDESTVANIVVAQGYLNGSARCEYS